MILYFILVFLGLFTCFFLPPILCIYLNRNHQNAVGPFFLGVLLCLITERCIIYYVLMYLSNISAAANISFTRSHLLYGLFTGLLTGFSIEYVSYRILKFLNYRGKWSSSTRKNMTYALGFGWVSAILNWGTFLWYMVSNTSDSQKLDQFGVTPYDLLLGLATRIVVTALFIGLTYLMQFGFSEEKGYTYLILTIIIHSFCAFILYAIPYVLYWPEWIAIILYGAIAAVMIKYGYILLHAHKVRKVHRYDDFNRSLKQAKRKKRSQS